ncbi:DUF4349 domain-containing protein [Hymenobacter sp. BT664]|uniref:DUF4349 domain-containing protein n=1 Tax=Hymenobacter montanus TaxID=2771359 RepID=A0A927BCX9_9BACT|nr:DUF4349 domain-containing protein [Hymenobacter montanus]MBD2767762.1 DUF4349 domain-containing protein [Hymenobacter montanus]
MKKSISALLLGLLALLSNCASKHEQSAEATTDTETVVAGNAQDESAKKEAEADYAAPAESSDEVHFTPPAAPTSTAPRPRLLIYHAELRLRVENVARTTGQLDSLVRRSGGYLSAAAETRDEDGRNEWRQEMTIRVRPGGFQSLLSSISRLGTVEIKKLSTDDVTAQHADITARLATKRAVEQRYVALLQQAKRIKDVLDIEEKIGEVREEIESTESRLKTLNDEVAYSTITLTCYQPLAQPTPNAPIVSLGSRLLEGLYDGWSLLTELLVSLVSSWPLLLLAGVVSWLVYRRWRRARAAKG